MTSRERQPFSSCATMSALITAERFWSGGYLAISRSIFLRDSALSISIRCSSIYFPEDDVLRADDGDGVGEHVAARHLVERREVRESRGADLEAVGLVRAVGHEVDAELALRMLDRRVDLAFGHVHALGDELEVVDELLHALLHLQARGRSNLVVVGHHRAGVGAQPVDTLPDDAVRLPELLDAHQVAVVAVAVLADRDVELHAVVDLVGLLLAQVPGDARAAQHRAGEAEGERALGRDHADA